MMVHKKMGSFFSTTNWSNTGNNANCDANGEKKTEEASPDGVVGAPVAEGESVAEGAPVVAEGESAAAEGAPVAAEGESVEAEGESAAAPVAAEGESVAAEGESAAAPVAAEGESAAAESNDGKKKTQIPTDQATGSAQNTKSGSTEAPKVGGAKKRRRTRRKHRAARKSSRKQ
jgi:hypothetical protein